MKFSRLNLVLGLALLALVIVDGLTWPRGETAREVLPLFEPWTPGQVATLRVEQGAQGDFAEDGELIVQRDARGVFRLSGHHDYPARPRAVEFLINGVASLNTMDLLSEDPASHGTYGLTGEKAVRIRLVDDQGRMLADLLQGDKAPGGRAFYVRRTDSDRVYRAPNFVRESVRGDLLIWIDSRWCGLDADLIQRIELTGLEPGASAPSVLVRDKGSRTVWKDGEGKPVPRARIQLFLRALSLVTIKDVTGRQDLSGTEPKAGVRIQLTQAGGTTWTGELHGSSAEGQRATIQLPMGTATDPEASASFGLLFPPASVSNLEKTMQKLRP